MRHLKVDAFYFNSKGLIQMHNYIEFFDKIPFWIIVALMAVFGLMQGIGEILEFKGKVVPEILQVRKLFARRKREKEAFRKMPDFIEKYEKKFDETSATLVEVQSLLKDVKEHYSEDNIAKRDGWIKEVNEHIAESDRIRDEQNKMMSALAEKLDKNNADTLSLVIDNKRNFILDFTSKAVDLSYPLTKEQYNRFFNVYKEYEEIIEENHLVNGQVDVAYNVVTKSYEERLKNHAFIEDSHGYNN